MKERRYRMHDVSPDDPILGKINTAPHEPPAVLRMHNAGHLSQAIVKLFRLRGTQFIKQIETAKVEKEQAAWSGRPVHEALITEEVE